MTLRLVVGRRPKGRRGAWRRSFPRSDRGYRMRHLSDLLANALPRPFRRRNAARQAGSISWSRVIRPRRQASGCLSARCTCGEAVRSPDERSEELCEAKSQEGAREPRRGRKGPSANTVSQPSTHSTRLKPHTTKTRGVSAAGFVYHTIAANNRTFHGNVSRLKCSSAVSTVKSFALAVAAIIETGSFMPYFLRALTTRHVKVGSSEGTPYT